MVSQQQRGAGWYEPAGAALLIPAVRDGEVQRRPATAVVLRALGYDDDGEAAEHGRVYQVAPVRDVSNRRLAFLIGVYRIIDTDLQNL